MSSFPYNNHKYNPAPNVNGCPITFAQAAELAHDVRYWHGEMANTDDWTQSGEGAREEEKLLALGLMELLSDPGAVRRLIMTGKSVRKSVELVLEMESYVDEMTEKRTHQLETIRELFGVD